LPVLNDFGSNASALAIGQRLGRLLEGFFEEAERLIHRGGTLVGLRLRSFSGAGLQCDPRLPGQLFEGFPEGEILGLHDPGKSVTLLAARPAAVVADIGAYIERRVSVVMKRTETLPVFSGTLKRNPLADQLDEIDACTDFVGFVGHTTFYV